MNESMYGIMHDLWFLVAVRLQLPEQPFHRATEDNIVIGIRLIIDRIYLVKPMTLLI